MKHRQTTAIRKIAVTLCLLTCISVLHAQDQYMKEWHIDTQKKLNPNTKWLREAKWGLFSHYMAHQASSPVSESMNGELWNKKVNSFPVRNFANQLTELKAPYFFITIGQAKDYYCSPNAAYEKLFGPSEGRLSERDLVAELAEELSSRGIKMGVYLPAKGFGESPEEQRMWHQVIREWSQRWGRNISAWWIDGAKQGTPEMFKTYTAAFKSGNPDALIAYNILPVGMTRRQLLPATEHEDYLAGESGFVLPTCGTSPKSLREREVFNKYNTTDYYQGPNICGDQLHFLTFMGSFWGWGEPRFPDAFVIGFTEHINQHGGTVTWDLRLKDNGIIPESFYKQINALSKSVNSLK